MKKTATKESLSNLNAVCAKHAPQPNPDLVKIAKKSPQTFLGWFVKKGFPAKKPDGSDTIEHMWVKVKEVKDGDLMGELNNDPLLDCGVALGDLVTVKPDEIEEALPPRRPAA